MNNQPCCNPSTGTAGDVTNPFTHTRERGFGGTGGSLPPLPEPQRFTGTYAENLDGRSLDGRTISGHDSLIKEGCYYIQLIPHSFDPPARYHYEGALRFQVNQGTLISSGDLYSRDFCQGSPYCPIVSTDGSGKNRIPVFPRGNYAYYLRVTGITPVSGSLDSIELTFEPYHFNHDNRSWECSDAPLTAKLALRTGIDGIRSWCGYVETVSGVVMGQLSAVWISPFLRQAEIEIDCVQGCELPLDNSLGEDWSHIFAKAGWDVYFRVSNTDVKNTGDTKWSTAELHKIMLENRDNVNLDKRWRYHMLAVPEFDDYDAFGVMYDHTSRDINDIPREGAAIAANIKFENMSLWGKCKSMRFGETRDPYFRTAIHEIGHAMMLRHPDNQHDNYIMQRTISVANNAEPPVEFPENIHWTFSPRDVHLLCHLPDIAVRPGGVSFGSPSQRLPVNARYEIIRLQGLKLNVNTLSNVVPIGAPVRVEFELRNDSGEDIVIPGSLSMKSGHISGKVIDPSGTPQEFATIMHYTRETHEQVLKPGESRKHSITLIWGTNGPLFPQPGFYRVALDFSWFKDGVRMQVSGSTTVLISAPGNKNHAEAAHGILSNSDTLLALAIGGDHRHTGSAAIRQAVADPVLKPHYALVEAKRVGQRFHERAPRLDQAADVLDNHTMMTRAEVKRISKIIDNTLQEPDQNDIDKTTAAHLHDIIATKAEQTGVFDDIADALAQLKRFC